MDGEAGQFRNHSSRQSAREQMRSFYTAHVDDVRRAVATTLRTSRIIATDEHEDIVQLTFVKLFDAWLKGSFDSAADIIGYVSTIARNAARDWLRRRRYEGGPDARSDFDPAQDLHSEANADVEVLLGALAELPADLVAVYQGRFVEGLSQSRLAARLGFSRQRIRTLEHRLYREALAAIERKTARTAIPTVTRTRTRNS
jgi:RNA polymerase sigma factor (sigma-70 family)